MKFAKFAADLVAHLNKGETINQIINHPTTVEPLPGALCPEHYKQLNIGKVEVIYTTKDGLPQSISYDKAAGTFSAPSYWADCQI